MIVILPSSVVAQDANRGMLHNAGGTYLNDMLAPPATAIFPDSLLQTLNGYGARIEMMGTAMQVGPETMMQFQGNLMVLLHGSLKVDTEREMPVLVGCVTVSPETRAQTQFDVTDLGEKVRITVVQNDVHIHYHGLPRGAKKGAALDEVLHPGEPVLREERCGPAPNPTQGYTAKGPIFGGDGPWLAGGGLVAVGIACLIYCRGNDPAPISASAP